MTLSEIVYYNNKNTIKINVAIAVRNMLSSHHEKILQ
jgi:hypothetical protein